MRRWAAALALALCACAMTPEPLDVPRPVAPPAPAPPPRSPAPQPPRQPGDACGAAALQHLVGRPRSEIPVPVNPDLQRVACTTCPVAQDFNPSRLNFFFDAETGVIRQVRCG